MGAKDTEVCPNCGNFVDQLNDQTGFCIACSSGAHDESLLVERYLEVNADEIEYWLLQGKSLNQAIDQLSKNGRHRTCLVCGSVLRHAPRNAVFCRRNPECRRYSRKYVYRYSEKGMNKSEALASILREIN